MTKKYTLITILIVLLLIVTSSLILILVLFTNKDSDRILPSTPIDKDQTEEAPISSTTNLPIDDNSLLEKFISSDGSYEYTYSNIWNFRREGVGLYPNNDEYYIDKDIEIVTIFTDNSSLSAKEWSQGYDGSGYEVEVEKTINGYDAYYVINRNGVNYNTVLYTLSHKGLIVHVVFREWLTINDNDYIDNSEYKTSVEDIVYSIKFLN